MINTEYVFNYLTKDLEKLLTYLLKSKEDCHTIYYACDLIYTGNIDKYELRTKINKHVNNKLEEYKDFLICFGIKDLPGIPLKLYMLSISKRSGAYEK